MDLCEHCKELQALMKAATAFTAEINVWEIFSRNPVHSRNESPSVIRTNLFTHYGHNKNLGCMFVGKFMFNLQCFGFQFLSIADLSGNMLWWWCCLGLYLVTTGVPFMMSLCTAAAIGCHGLWRLFL
jgi:hypothetical protein